MADDLPTCRVCDKHADRPIWLTRDEPRVKYEVQGMAYELQMQTSDAGVFCSWDHVWQWVADRTGDLDV